MTIQDIIRLDDALTDEGQLLMLRKNSDYAGDDIDPLRNFRRFGAIGVLVRLSDKLARLQTFIERRTYAVKEESFRDTILDARNYLTILLALCPQPEQDPPKPFVDDGRPLEYKQVANVPQDVEQLRSWNSVDQITGQRVVDACGCGCGK